MIGLLAVAVAATFNGGGDGGGDTPIEPITADAVALGLAVSDHVDDVCQAYPAVVVIVAGATDDFDLATEMVDAWALDGFATGWAPDHSAAFTAEGRAAFLSWLHSCDS